MPPILESPVNVAGIESVNLLDAQVVTTADDVCVLPILCPAPDSATLSVHVADGIGLADRMA